MRHFASDDATLYTAPLKVAKKLHHAFFFCLSDGLMEICFLPFATK